MLLLTKEEINIHQDATSSYIWGKESLKILLKVKIIRKLKIVFIMLVNIEVQHIVFVI